MDLGYIHSIKKKYKEIFSKKLYQKEANYDMILNKNSGNHIRIPSHFTL